MRCTPLFSALLLAGAVLMATELRGQSDSASSTTSDSQAVAREAVEVMKTYCYACHGVEFEVPGFDVLHRPSLTAARTDELSYIAPGDPDKSAVWQRLGVDQDMPPKKVKNRPSDAQIAIVKKWIESGAAFPENTSRKWVSEETVLREIRDDLQDMSREDRPHQRYLSLHTISNNKRFTESDLRLYRAAVVKLLNSVSRSSRLELPPMIDAPKDQPYEGLVFRVDLRRFGWASDQWLGALNEYPYGIVWNDDKLQEISKDIEELIGAINYDGLPYIRADWFITKAARPRNYHLLLGIPETIDELEKSLGIDVKRDFNQDRLQRAGFAGSGVSHQNRLIDRHEGSVTPYYYRSYDFDKNFGRGILFRFPLGPRFDGNDFDQHAFEHAGGEIIWSLPNGMQGYMLIDNQGKRIDVGPIQIVRDMREISGSPEIVNGLSCMGCHKHGMLDYADAIRNTEALTDQARRKVSKLFKPADEMQKLVDADRARFMKAQAEIILPYLQLHENREKSLVEFPEPISTVAKLYDQDMGLEDVVSEIGTEVKLEAVMIRTNQKLKDLGLGPLAVGSTIPRRMWETREESPSSIHQRAVFALGSGRGVNVQ